MVKFDLEDILDVPFTLKQRPVAISAELRPARRLAVLVLILDHCREARANLEQLHVLNWAIRNEESRRDFLDFLRGDRAPDPAVARYDPSLSRVIALALADGLVRRNEHQEQPKLASLDVTIPPKNSSSAYDYRIILSDQGKALAEMLAERKDCLQSERTFLKQVGRKITQKLIHQLLFWEKP